MTWVIFRIMPHKEKKFMNFVESCGFRDCCYTPMGSFLRKKGVSKGSYVVRRPVMVGYVFLKMIPFVYYAAIEGSMVLYVVRHVDDLCYLKDDVIESLQERERRGDFDGVSEENKIKRMSMVGMPVRIMTGAFQGRCGIFERVTRTNKVWIQVDGVRVILPLAIEGKVVYELA
jgi:transcription antitermination factor NusG